jgi:hypothetical protein
MLWTGLDSKFESSPKIFRLQSSPVHFKNNFTVRVQSSRVQKNLSPVQSNSKIKSESESSPVQLKKIFTVRVQSSPVQENSSPVQSSPVQLLRKKKHAKFFLIFADLRDCKSGKNCFVQFSLYVNLLPRNRRPSSLEGNPGGKISKVVIEGHGLPRSLFLKPIATYGQSKELSGFGPTHRKTWIIPLNPESRPIRNPEPESCG